MSDLSNPITIEGFLIWNLVITLLLAMFAYLFYNTQRLKSQGFNEEYIKFIRKWECRGTFISWLSLMGFQALSYFIFSLFLKEISLRLYIQSVFLLALVLSIIIRFFFDKVVYKHQKELAIRTGAEIVVDFNYRILHKIFIPLLEIIATVLVAAFTFICLSDIPDRDNNFVIYFYLVFIWYFYISLKSARNMIMPQFEYVYRLNAKLLFLFNAILILLVFSNSMETAEKGNFSALDYIFMAAVIALLVAKLTIYIKGYRSLKKSLPSD